MKDYNKTPFKKRPKPPSKPSPFTPTSGVFTHSIQTGITTWSPDEQDGFDLPPASHIAESSSSRQGYSDIRTPGRSQPIRQTQALDQNKLSSGFSRHSIVDDGYSVMTPKLTLVDNPFGTPSTTLNLMSPVKETPRRNTENHIVKPLSKSNQLNNTQSLHISKGTPRQAITRSFLPSYDSTRPPGESSSGPKPSVLSKDASQNEPSLVNHDMASPSEPTASSVIPPQPKGPHYSVPSVVSNLPTAKSVATRTEPSLSSSQPTTRTAAPQTAAVKRRLGMGRMTNSYPNKKFKHPV